MPSLSTNVLLALLGAESRRPGLGSSGKFPPMPDACPSSIALLIKPLAFVGEVEVSLAGRIFGRRFSVVIGGRPSLIACLVCATAMGDRMSFYAISH